MEFAISTLDKNLSAKNVICNKDVSAVREFFVDFES